VRPLLCGLVAAGCTACVSFGTLQTASTLGRGGYEVSLEPSVHSHYGPGNPQPNGSISVRGQYGLTDRIDLGLRLGGPGLQALAKFQLTDPTRPGWVASLAPSVGAFLYSSADASGGLASLDLPLLFGLPVGQSHQLVLAPKLHQWLLFGQTQGVDGVVAWLNVGASVGFAWAISDRLRVLPELSLVYPLVGHLSYAGVSGTAIGGRNGVVAQLSLAVMVGRP
jgi:hypothetical protein